MCIWDDVPQTTNDFYPFAIMCGVYLVSNEVHISCAYHMCISIGGVRATLEDDHILCHELGEGFYTLCKYDLKHQVRDFLVRSNTSDYRLFMSDNRLFTSRTHALSTAI